MTSLRVEILTPEAVPMLEKLVQQKQIRIHEPQTKQNELIKAITKFQNSMTGEPTFEEITEVVEEVRKARHAEQKKM
ncbi:MAG: hypothetical protein ACRCUY_10415 [Thermoguttaceae bacterium]